MGFFEGLLLRIERTLSAIWANKGRRAELKCFLGFEGRKSSHSGRKFLEKAL